MHKEDEPEAFFKQKINFEEEKLHDNELMYNFGFYRVP